MVEILVTPTPQEACEMRAAIKQLEIKEAQAAQNKQQILIDEAEKWWKTIEPLTPTTRDEALSVVRFIEDLQKSEKDGYRLGVLRNELKKSLIKLQERKKNG